MNHHLVRLLFALSLVGLLQLYPSAASAAPHQQDTLDIIETAAAAESFNILLTALDAADLVATLKGEGPFTLFAPTDEAFAALPAGTLEALLQDPGAALADILLYHVVNEKMTATNAVNAIGGELEMMNGHKTTFNVEGNRLLLNSAGFLEMDLQASNGIIHVIDQVLLPPATTDAKVMAEAVTANATAEAITTAEAAATVIVSSEAAEAAATSATEETAADIVNTITAADDFTALAAAIKATGLGDVLKSEGPFTLFAPTDEAFAALPKNTIDILFADPTGTLTDILLYHVVPGKIRAADITALNGESIATVGGPALAIVAVNGLLTVDDAQVMSTDIEATNGVIHVIDRVLVPSRTDREASTASSANTGAESTQTAGGNGNDSAASTADSTADGTSAVCADVYYVQKGDTLSGIAARYGVTVQTLVGYNRIGNPDLIYRNQAICIPK